MRTLEPAVVASSPPWAAARPQGPATVQPLWQIRVMGGLQLHSARGGAMLRLPVKLRQLLLLLLCARLRGPVAMSTLGDTLWQDSEGAAARSNLYSAIHRLRQLLGCAQILHVQDNGVWLDDELIAVDLDRLRNIQDQLGGLQALGPAALVELGIELLVLTRSGGLGVPGGGGTALGADARHVLLCWRSVTRELACQLDACGHTALAIRLCERFTSFGCVDEGLLGLWTQLLMQSGQHIAARHVSEQYGPQCRLL